MPCRRRRRIGLRSLPQLRKELRPEGGVEHAVYEEVGGRVEDEAEQGDVLEDLDPEREVEAVGIVPTRQNYYHQLQRYTLRHQVVPQVL